MHVAVLWLCCCVYLNCVGWALSVIHQLNAAGYALILLPGIYLALAWLKRKLPVFNPQKLFQRFRRPLPAIFLLLASLIFLGGILYAPTNYDALTYRLPRMLNWLAAGQWFWIPTFNNRMNYSAVAWEWTAMPLLALMRSDRALFLINALGFLLMPGLLFSVFRQLGIARRVAWAWMWILPLAYGYALQAGSVGNDLMGTLCCLLSVHFGLRARQSGRVTEVWLALLAAALMTGVKISNAPLALPCIVAVWPALRQVRKHLAGSVAVAGVAVLVSAAPMMTLNYLHTGSWNGDPENKLKMQISNPAAALLGNGLLLVQHTLVPPILPAAEKINRVFSSKLPAAWQRLLHANFPRYYGNRLNQLESEESAGLGLAVTLPLLCVAGVSLAGWRRMGPRKSVFTLLPPVVLAAWVAIAVYLLKMGSEAGPRLMLPYYPLALVPILLLPAAGGLWRWRLWKIFLVFSALSILPALVFSPARPLWPAQTVCNNLLVAHPNNTVLKRAAGVYAAYASRNDALAPVRAMLPENVREIGFIAGDNDTDYSLWRPFGWRSIKYPDCDEHYFLAPTTEVEWVVVKERYWPTVCPEPLAIWATAHRARIVGSVSLVELVGWGAETWSVLHFEK